MNWLTLLTIEYVFFMLLSLALSRGRLVTPGVLFFGSFSVMLLSSMIFNNYLEIQLKDETFWMVSAAGLMFLLVEQTYRFISTSQMRYRYADIKKNKNDANIRKPIVVQNLIVNFFIFLMVLSLFIILYNLLTKYGSNANLNQIMHANKVAKTYTRGRDALQFFSQIKLLKYARR